MITITTSVVRIGRGAMQYMSNGGNVGSDLREQGTRVANIGTKEMNESNRKQDADAMQENGTKWDNERGLWPGVRPL